MKDIKDMKMIVPLFISNCAVLSYWDCVFNRGLWERAKRRVGYSVYDYYGNSRRYRFDIGMGINSKTKQKTE